MFLMWFSHIFAAAADTRSLSSVRLRGRQSPEQKVQGKIYWLNIINTYPGHTSLQNQKEKK